MQPCEQEVRIRQMELDLAVAKSDIKNVKDDIKEVRSDMKEVKHSIRGLSEKVESKFDKQTWFFISMLISTIGSLAMIIYNVLRG